MERTQAATIGFVELPSGGGTFKGYQPDALGGIKRVPGEYDVGGDRKEASMKYDDSGLEQSSDSAPGPGRLEFLERLASTVVLLAAPFGLDAAAPPPNHGPAVSPRKVSAKSAAAKVQHHVSVVKPFYKVALQSSQSKTLTWANMQIKATDGRLLATMTQITLVLFLATDTNGTLRSWKTFSFTIVPNGWSTNASYVNGYQGGLWTVLNLENAAGGTLQQWTTPPTNISCGEGATPISYSDGLDPNIYNLTQEAQLTILGTRPDGLPVKWLKC
jgi:hypothetical protein